MKIAEQSVKLIDSMGSDNSVVNAARVSFHKEASNFTEEQNIRLIQYLCKHGHWSPLAHAFLSFRIKSPIFVARQLVKHQVGLAWNEVSRRYVDEEPEFWFPNPSTGWRKKAENVKQGSSADVAFQGNPIYFLTQRCLQCYNELLAEDIAPEVARICLPLNTMTEWIWSGSLMAFARVCKLRLDPHAQAETREVAKMINDQVPKELEHSWTALLK